MCVDVSELWEQCSVWIYWVWERLDEAQRNSDLELGPFRLKTGITLGNSTARNQANTHYWIQLWGQMEGEGQPQGICEAQRALGRELRTRAVPSLQQAQDHAVTVGSGNEKVVISAPLIGRKGGRFSQNWKDKLKCFMENQMQTLEQETGVRGSLSYGMYSMWTSSA